MAYKTVGLSSCRTIELSNYRAVGLAIGSHSIDAQGSRPYSAQFFFFLPFCFILPSWSVCSVPPFWLHPSSLPFITDVLKKDYPILNNLEWVENKSYLSLQKNNLQVSFFNNLGSLLTLFSDVWNVLNLI